jgi:hypothetical protein
MTNPEHLRPGCLVPCLALDAAVPLFSVLHAPPDDGSLRLHIFLKEAVEYGQFVAYHKDLWQAVETYAQSTLSPDDRHQWLGWMTRAFQGLRPPTPDLSDWLITLEDYRYTANSWQNPLLTKPQADLVRDLVDRYFEELNEDAFMELVQECQARPLSPWDKRLHQAYNFVYFDRQGGNDPFLLLKFVNQGEALRRALRATDLTHPDFPHQALVQRNEVLFAELGMTARQGAPLAPLVSLL